MGATAEALKTVEDYAAGLKTQVDSLTAANSAKDATIADLQTQVTTASTNQLDDADKAPIAGVPAFVAPPTT